jgi:hypothetical protein
LVVGVVVGRVAVVHRAAAGHQEIGDAAHRNFTV